MDQFPSTPPSTAGRNAPQETWQRVLPKGEKKRKNLGDYYASNPKDDVCVNKLLQGFMKGEEAAWHVWKMGYCCPGVALIFDSVRVDSRDYPPYIVCRCPCGRDMSMFFTPDADTRLDKYYEVRGARKTVTGWTWP